jgi:hypothetical protein
VTDDLRRLLYTAVRTELRATVTITTLVLVLAGYLLACGAAPSAPLWLTTSGTLAQVGLLVAVLHAAERARRTQI